MTRARSLRRSLPLVAALLLALVGTALAQSSHEVRMLIRGGPAGTEFYFEPAGLHVEPGDTVRFVAETPHHTVTAYHAQQGKPMRVPPAAGPFSSPVVPVGESWEHTFTVPGTYDLWCAPHEMMGMVMRIVVGEPGGPAGEPIADTGPMGVFGAAAAVLSSPQLAPQAIVAAGAVSWDELPAEVHAPPAAAGH